MAHLFIVARQSPELFSYMAREFASEPDVTVILDRRERQRRQKFQTKAIGGPDRRRRPGDRRRTLDVGGQLTTLGYAFVRLD